MSWLLQNTVTLGLLFAMGTFAFFLMRRPYWRNAFRNIFSRRNTRVCAVILAIFVLVALADSIGWRDVCRNPDTGEVLRFPDSGEVIYSTGMSVLDRLLTPLRERREFTYSAPLASHSYAFENLAGENGQIRRVHGKLKYPGMHLLGTDRIGNDVLYLCLKSVRTGMIIGLLTTLVAIPFAILFGVLAGYYGGIVDDVIQYFYTVINAIPTVLFIAAFIVLFGAGLTQLCVAMGLASWTSLCRLLRAETLKLRGSDFVAAASACGIPSWRIIMRHILPNILHVIIITTVLRFSTEVLSEAVLTYLGIGVGADTMSWGTMINDARSELARSPVIWWKLAAAFSFMLALVLPANFFADAVRDALDPRTNS